MKRSGGSTAKDGGQLAKAAKITDAGSTAWSEHGTLHVADYGSSPSSLGSIAAFDLDDTIIATKSGKVFAESADDWRWWHPQVPAKLRQCAERGHRLVIVSNQSGIGSGRNDKAAFRTKVDAVQRQLGLPLLVLVATGDDLYRKPRVGMWSWLESNGGHTVSRSESFYVGDAAGRPEVKRPKIKKDFSDSDLKFALNIGIKFHTPEAYFLGHGADIARPVVTDFAFDPRSLGSLDDGVDRAGLAPLGSQELVVVVGPPGSGKSSLAVDRLTEYERVNQDTLKTRDKCLEACRQALAAGKSVVVDNQNKDAATRKLYIDAAKAAGVPVRAVLVDVPKEMCFHLNCYRSLNTKSPEHRGADRVPSMVIHKYFKEVQRPKTEEGFVEVVTLTMANFRPRGTEADIMLLKSFLGA